MYQSNRICFVVLLARSRVGITTRVSTLNQESSHKGINEKG